MTFLLKVMEKQTEQFREMQLQMEQEMQRENRDFQREVREESRNIMAAIPELIVQTVSKMGFAFNVHPLNNIEGGPAFEKHLLIGNSSASPKSSDSLQSDPSVRWQPPPSEPAVVNHVFEESSPLIEVTVTPAPTLRGPVDRLVCVNPVKGVSPSMDNLAVDLDMDSVADVSNAAALPNRSDSLVDQNLVEDLSAAMDMSADDLEFTTSEARESSRLQERVFDKELNSAGRSVISPIPYNPKPSRWLNVVLDLNGVLCVCKERRFMPRGQRFAVGVDPH